MNPKRMLKEDIKFLNDARVQKKNGIVTENATNDLKLNMGYMKQWNGLAKAKLDPIRYYVTILTRATTHPTSKPQEFSSFVLNSRVSIN